MAGKPRYEAPATARVRLQLTPAQHRDLCNVARENRMTVPAVVREAVNAYVADYREIPVFPRRRRPAR